MSRISLLAALAALCVAFPAWSQTTLVRKHVEGSEYQTRATVNLDQKLMLSSRDLGTKSNTVVELKTTVGKRDAEGKLPLAVATSIKSAEITLPGGAKIKFDGANPDAKDEGPANPLYEILRDRIKANAKNTMEITLDKENKVLEVKGLKPETGASEEDVKLEYTEEGKNLPDKPVKKGDAWEREIISSVGQGQLMKFKRKFTYEGETFKGTVNSTQKLEKITAVDSEVTFTVREGGAFPGKVTKSELKVVDSKHTMLFDPALGRFVESSSKVQVAGPIGISIAGQELGGDLDLTMETKTEEFK